MQHSQMITNLFRCFLSWSGSLLVQKSLFCLGSAQVISAFAEEQIPQGLDPAHPPFDVGPGRGAGLRGEHEVGLGDGVRLALEDEVVVDDEKFDRLAAVGVVHGGQVVLTSSWPFSARRTTTMNLRWWRSCDWSLIAKKFLQNAVACNLQIKSLSEKVTKIEITRGSH